MKFSPDKNTSGYLNKMDPTSATPAGEERIVVFKALLPLASQVLHSLLMYLQNHLQPEEEEKASTLVLH